MTDIAQTAAYCVAL